MEKIIHITKKLAIPMIFLIILIGAIIGVVNFQKKNSKVEIIISEPSDGFTTEKDNVVVKGETNNINNEIFVNSVKAEVMDEKTFQSKTPLSDGDNEIKIEVLAKNGKRTSKSILGKKIVVNTPSIGKEKLGNKGNSPRGEVLGESSDAVGTFPTSIPPKKPLTQAGPKENATVIIGSLIIMIYYYLKSKKELVASQKH